MEEQFWPKNGNHEKAKNRTGTHPLTVNFREIRVRDCFSIPGLCNGVGLMVFNGEVILRDSSLKDKIQSMTGVLTVVNTGSKINVSISGCTFARDIGNKLKKAFLDLSPTFHKKCYVCRILLVFIIIWKNLPVEDLPAITKTNNK